MSLLDRTRNWIDTQGYPLEMQVAQLVRQSGGWWDHSRSYEDPITGKTREIDLMGVYGGKSATVQLVFECKHSRDKPWVAFCTDQLVLSPSGYVSCVPMTEPIRDHIEAISRDRAVQELAFFQTPSRVGFTLAKAHTDIQDQAFHALGTVVAASAALAAKMAKYGHTTLFVPVIVVDSPLLCCHLPEGSVEYQLEECEEAVVLRSAASGDRTPVRVMTLEGLSAFLRRVSSDAEVLVRQLGNP